MTGFEKCIVFLAVNDTLMYFYVVLKFWDSQYSMERVCQEIFLKICCFCHQGFLLPLSGYFHNAVKDKTENKISPSREKPPNLCNSVKFCCTDTLQSRSLHVFSFSGQSPSHLAREQVNNQPLLSLLHKITAIGNSRGLAGSALQFLLQASPQFHTRTVEGSKEASTKITFQLDIKCFAQNCLSSGHLKLLEADSVQKQVSYYVDV